MTSGFALMTGSLPFEPSEYPYPVPAALFPLPHSCQATPHSYVYTCLEQESSSGTLEEMFRSKYLPTLQYPTLYTLS